jgi:hypothetical protein
MEDLLDNFLNTLTAEEASKFASAYETVKEQRELDLVLAQEGVTVEECKTAALLDHLTELGFYDGLKDLTSEVE